VTRTQSARYLTRKIAAAHAVLANPTATDPQRRGARCRLNRAVLVLRALAPIPPMKHGLSIDRIPVWMRPALSRAD
jgi:hypothetical protein